MLYPAIIHDSPRMAMLVTSDPLVCTGLWDAVQWRGVSEAGGIKP